MPIAEYYVDIWDHTKGTKLLRFRWFTTLWYEDSIDRGGAAQMTIWFQRPELDTTILQPMNRIEIGIGSTIKWVGYIRKWTLRGEIVTVEMMGALGILTKRIVNENYGNQDTRLIFNDVVNDMNAADDTGITLGTFDYNVIGITVTASASTDKFTATSHGLANGSMVKFDSTGTLPGGITEGTTYYVINQTSNDFEVSIISGGTKVDLTSDGTATIKVYNSKAAFNWTKQRIFDALSSLAEVAGGELFIDTDFSINIAAPRGSDKSQNVQFKLLDGRPNETNMTEIDVDYDGDKLVNTVYGNNASLNSTQTDATSESTYGMLEEAVTFNAENSQATLDNATLRYLQTFKDPLEIPKIQPITEKIPEADYDVGDTVTVKIERGFYSLDTTLRIVSKRVTVRQDKQVADVQIGVSDRAQSRSDLLLEIAENAQRVYNLERA